MKTSCKLPFILLLTLKSSNKSVTGSGEIDGNELLEDCLNLAIVELLHLKNLVSSIIQFDGIVGLLRWVEL